MIEIQQKSNCCGCSACVQACTKKCITMREDEEGFLYPIVDKDSCIGCGLCEKVCPVINQSEKLVPILVSAAKNPDEAVRLQSSSGGIFSMLAEKVIYEGGVVFGARFDENWNVIHDYTTTIAELSLFRGSKYVQSIIGNSFIQARKFLIEGKKVLFSGTPCQIRALKLFLRRDYENLLTVDVVCHGVPSPGVWRSYLEYILRHDGAAEKNTVLFSLKEMSEISDITFRDKSTGWKKYGFVVMSKSALKADKNSVCGEVSAIDNIEYLHETLDVNIFMRGFLKDLYLRPSCYDCPSKSGKSHSDITIADFWGVNRYYPEFDDDKGVGLVLVNSEKGNSILSSLNIDKIETTYNQAFANNPAIIRSARLNKWRKIFWQEYKVKGIDAIVPICESMKPRGLKVLYFKTRFGIAKIIKRIIGKK